MYPLNSNDFIKVLPLIKSQNELSVFSVINGFMPGDVYVNNIDHPTVALIRTSECNYIAGSTTDIEFNSKVSEVLDFWGPLTPDTEEWLDVVPAIHKNNFIRKYTRRHYVLSKDNFRECSKPLKAGFVLEQVNIEQLNHCSYKNADNLLEWIENWEDDAKFTQYGAGNYIHNGEVIVSWSLSDCCSDTKIAIGIHTDEKFRKNGFGELVVSATVKDCFAKGYETIDWLCVDSNKGSIAIAEKLGFQLIDRYYAFSSYPPIENHNDLTELQWNEWGQHLETASKTSDFLIWDAINCYVKANNVQKVIGIMTTLEQNNITPDYTRYQNFIHYLQSCGLCSNFRSQPWIDFINKRITG